MDTFDVVVVGAGITGCSTAYDLARSGAKVIVIDRFGPAAMASGWTLAGVRQSGRHPTELPLAMAAIDLWQTLHEELGGETHYTRHGNLRLARDEREYALIRAMVSEQQALGLALDFLPDTASVRGVAPAISREIPGASFCPTDGHADPLATSAAYVGALKRLGVQLAMGEDVEAIEAGAGRICGVRTSVRRIAADSVVLAAGVFGNALLEPLGLSVPLRTPMVAVLRSAPIAPVLDQVIGVCGGDWAGRQQVDGRLRITSGALEWDGAFETIDTEHGLRPAVRPPMSSLREVVEKLEALMPGLSAAPIEECWAGLLDLTPDALPVMDRAPGLDGLVIGMGFSGHGFGIAPVTGQILSGLVSGAEQVHDISPFQFNRFADITTSAVVQLHG